MDIVWTDSRDKELKVDRIALERVIDAGELFNGSLEEERKRVHYFALYYIVHYEVPNTRKYYQSVLVVVNPTLIDTDMLRSCSANVFH